MKIQEGAKETQRFNDVAIPCSQKSRSILAGWPGLWSHAVTRGPLLSLCAPRDRLYDWSHILLLK